MAQNITLETLCSILTAALDQHPTKPLVLALDGRCGSGKTTLTNALVRQFPASAVLRTDDFYLPSAQRAHGWEQTPCARPTQANRYSTGPTPAGRARTNPRRSLPHSRW